MQTPVKRHVMLLTVLLLVSLVSAGGQSSEPTASGKPVSYWIEALKSSDMGERIDATTNLAGMGPKAVPYLVRALEQDRSDGRLRLLSTLGMVGQPAQSALPAIALLLRDDSAAIRVTAAATMLTIDCSARREAWPVLIAALEGDSFSASLAASTLGFLGPDGVGAVPSLIPLVRSGSNEVRLAAIGALWKMGPSAKDAVGALEGAVQEGGDIARAAMSALETIKGEAPTPVPPCSARGDKSQKD
jgi:HEAT repeat protein